jgi:Bacteriophage HK97-gp10, putative tail-component
MPARTIEVKVTGQDKIKANVAYLRQNFPDWLAEANRETAEQIRDEAQNILKQLDAFDTGELYNSLTMGESTLGLRVTVYSTSKHAPFIEFGTSPHFPPLDKIRAWCARKGIPVSAAFPIARAISERGTPERPFLYPAYKVGIRRHIDRVRRFVGAGLQKLA